MLKDKIKADFKEAFKAKDQVKLSVLKMVNSEIGNAEINKRAKLIKDGKTENVEALSVLNDEEVLQVVGREVKIRELAKKAVEQSGAKGEKETCPPERRIGKVMAILAPQIKGKADGSLANKIVRELLN